MLKSYKFCCGGLLITLSLHEQTTDRKYLSEEGQSLFETYLKSLKTSCFEKYFIQWFDSKKNGIAKETAQQKSSRELITPLLP